MNLRILHVLASSLGGGASHVFDLISHAAPGIEQKLVVGSDGGTLANRLRAQGIEVEELEITKGWKWSALLRLAKFLRTYKPDIVHCHGFRAGLYGRIAARVTSRQIKTVLTIHGFHFYYSQSRLKKKALMWLERLLNPLTDYVIAVSKTDREHLLECRLTSEKKSRMILNGIPSSAMIRFNRHEGHIRLGLSNQEGPVVATVARLHFQKGVVYFLESIPSILKEFPDSVFLVIGDGPERQQLQKKALDLNVFQQVHFLGNREDVDELLRAVDIFVLASLWEGLPLSLLEAMRAGIPVIATDVDGNRDVVEEGISGLLVPPMNGEAIAKAVAKLIGAPQFAKNLVKNANIRLNTEFSLTRMLDETRKTYVDLMNKE